MEIVFGTVGSRKPAERVFSLLDILTAESNPGLKVTRARSDNLSLAFVSRAFTHWRAEGEQLDFFLDGEILEIDEHDTEARGVSSRDRKELAGLYRRGSSSFWARLDGTFCLIVQDQHVIQIGIDVSGTRSLYWWLSDGVLAFHSHLLDLAPTYPDQLREDAGNIGNFLATGTFLPGHTAYREVRHLGAGRLLTFKSGQATVDDHFRMNFQPDLMGRGRNQLVEELSDLLSGSIGRCWRAARAPVIPLSGGMDSRYIAAEAVRLSGDPALVRTITWGEEPDRPGGDGVIARDVARVLGVENVFHEKSQSHLATEFERTLYLSSGEADVAVRYPDDHLLHAQLVDEHGFSSMFRGDECFSRGLLLTRRALLPANDLCHLYPENPYTDLLDPDVLRPMVQEHARLLEQTLAGIRSSTPTGCRDELYYSIRMRQVLAVYNRVKHADLEVYNPLLGRRILEWNQSIPDELRVKRNLFQAALIRNFPQVATVPYATISNLPSWNSRFRTMPQLIRFYQEWCAAPGWLDSTGGKQQVLQALEHFTAMRGSGSGRPTRRGKTWKSSLKETLPGRLVRELVLERRFASHIPLYLRLGRLAVLHGLLGRIQQRRSTLRGGFETLPEASPT